MIFPYGTSSGYSVHLYPWLHDVFLKFSYYIQYYTKINRKLKNYLFKFEIMYLNQDKIKIILIFISGYTITSGIHGKQIKDD